MGRNRTIRSKKRTIRTNSGFTQYPLKIFGLQRFYFPRWDPWTNFHQLTAPNHWVLTQRRLIAVNFKICWTVWRIAKFHPSFGQMPQINSNINDSPKELWTQAAWISSLTPSNIGKYFKNIFIVLDRVSQWKVIRINSQKDYVNFLNSLRSSVGLCHYPQWRRRIKKNTIAATPQKISHPYEGSKIRLHRYEGQQR